MERSSSRTELLYARSKIAAYGTPGWSLRWRVASAYGIAAIDMVCINFRDLDCLKEEALEGRRLGFTGKQVIHPAQVDTVNACYRPSDAQVARAKQLVLAYEEHAASGKGAFAFEGIVADLPGKMAGPA